MAVAQRIGVRLPAPVKRLAQGGLAFLDPLVVRRHRRRTGDRRPIPPVSLRARVGGVSISDFQRAGAWSADLIESAFAAVGRDIATAGPLLDLACGCGRTLAFLAERHPELELHGCDIDRPALAWLARNYPQIDTAVNGFEPPLPYPDGRFGSVVSVSLFTHLDAARQERWISEVRRVLAPGGVAVVSVHSPEAFTSFASGASPTAIPPERLARHAPLERAGFVFEATPPSRWNALRFIDADGGWGLAFHTEPWLREHWGPHFASLRLLRTGAHQEAVVLEAPAR